mmetsp:Transcript_9733/g.27231  ORF Transcript_9733/g.27231 Transcript_9733/m.27231 type:complete len:200 (-) Transcript_9733:8-607(-)
MPLDSSIDATMLAAASWASSTKRFVTFRLQSAEDPRAATLHCQWTFHMKVDTVSEELAVEFFLEVATSEELGRSCSSTCSFRTAGRPAPECRSSEELGRNCSSVCSSEELGRSCSSAWSFPTPGLAPAPENAGAQFALASWLAPPPRQEEAAGARPAAPAAEAATTAKRTREQVPTIVARRASRALSGIGVVTRLGLCK